MKTLLTFASRSCAALKSRLGVPVMAGVLALALAAAPLPAMAMEDDRTDESVLAVPATASGEAAGEKTGADANADEEATQTVTIYHFELVHYDDPTLEGLGRS